MPRDSLLISFRTQLLHSKITFTLTFLPLAINPLFFLFTQLFYFRNEEEKKKLLTRNPIMKYFIAIKSIENISNTMISNYQLVIVFHLSILYAFVVRDLYYLLYIFVLPLLIQREPEFRCG